MILVKNSCKFLLTEPQRIHVPGVHDEWEFLRKIRRFQLRSSRAGDHKR